MDPKTPRSRRAVELTGRTASALEEVRSRQGFQRFATPGWRASGIDLRHIAANVTLEAGIHPKVVQDMLGHKPIATTLDTYSHVLPALHRDAVRVLEVCLSGTDATG